MINIQTIVGVLSGSLATLAIKELINQFNKKQEFNRELKKLTYEKKLEKAENAIAYYWTYSNKVVEQKKSFELILSIVDKIEDSDKDIQIIYDLLKKNSDALAELSGGKYSSINAIHLYFDLEESDKWNEKDISDLLQALSETKSIDNEISFWLSWYNKAIADGDEKLADIYWEKSKEALPRYKIALQKYIDSVEKNKLAINSIIANIKTQLKRY